MAFFPFRKHLGLLAQAGRGLAYIICLTEIHRYLIPEVLPHGYNITANTAHLVFKDANFPSNMLMHILHSKLLFLPLFILITQVGSPLPIIPKINIDKYIWVWYINIDFYLFIIV
ncbi:hypothetical protein D3C78_1144410 [compost metagenome]